MAAGGFRKAQLFQGDVQFQPGIQAFRLGPKGRRFTFQGSDLAGGGIQFSVSFRPSWVSSRKFP